MKKLFNNLTWLDLVFFTGLWLGLLVLTIMVIGLIKEPITKTQIIYEYVPVELMDGYEVINSHDLHDLEFELELYKEAYKKVYCTWNIGDGDYIAVINSNTTLPLLPNLGFDISSDCEGVKNIGRER